MKKFIRHVGNIQYKIRAYDKRQQDKQAKIHLQQCYKIY